MIPFCNPICQFISRFVIVNKRYIPSCFGKYYNILDNIGYLIWSLNLIHDDLNSNMRITFDSDIW